MIELYIPKYEELWFREKLLSDAETMSYNRAWGGTISFPQEKWEDWYDRWVLNTGGKRFYRYLKDISANEFVGETAYHFDDEKQIYLADIIVFSKYRKRGYGNEGLKLLCGAAKENGLDFLFDDIAADNPSAKLFLNNGFSEEYRTEKIVMLKKKLKD